MTATIQEKSGYWYEIIQWYDAEGKQIKKWRKTGYTVKGNHKREALQKAEEIKHEFERKAALKDSDMLFSDWMLEWLELTKHGIKASTYSTYKKQIKNCIVPYFKERKIKLCDLKPEDIQLFYNHKQEVDGAKGATVQRYHANIHKALDYAVKTGRINRNPSDTAEKPKADKFIADYFTEDEMITLLENASGSPIEIPVYLAAVLGLRRGECIGLRWSSINLDAMTLAVNGVIKDKGKGTTRNRDLYFDPMPKTKDSIRTLPIPLFAVEYLKALKEEQDQRKQKKDYNHKWDDYVCVRPNGDLIPLEQVTRAFPKLCKKCGLKQIRFHELRHSNISLLLAHGMDLKEIQQHAGHKDIRMTMNQYGHLQPVNRRTAAITQGAFARIGRLNK